ncbi:MAG: hypothetical protein HY852_04030 [Bradyrhizobium sp.]|uniref:hypothetical protein n=1 Tax=Bradyrhizobium sp. TaxID=376 RepID=UPI0025C44A86|nr:hypothetical protein [Bradyrhizobium sp.]MBI5260971.1 hypothetical protein [Bradyrhizobium sp.]
MVRLSILTCLIAVLGLTIGLAFSTYARAATLRLTLEKGQVYTWEWKIFRSTETGGKPKQSHESSTPVSLRVLDRTRNGYLLELQNGRTVFDPKLQLTMADPAMAELLKFLETLKVRFLVTRDGEVEEVVNFKDVKEAAGKVVDAAAPTGAPDRAVLLRIIEQLTGSKESLKVLALRDVGLMFYGTNVDPGMKEPADYETELPNVFGGRPLKATGQLTLKAADRKSKTAEFEVEQKVDNDSFLRMMKDLGTKVGKQAPKGVLEDMMKNASIRDNINVTVDLDSGLAIHAKRVRTSMIANTVKIDQVELTLQK